MSKTVNRVILIGNVGSDPEYRETPNRVYRQHDELKRHTDWHRLTFWRNQAETARDYVRRGSRLYIEGHLEYGSYERDGVKMPTVDVVVESFTMLDPRPNNAAAPEAESQEFVAV